MKIFRFALVVCLGAIVCARCGGGSPASPSSGGNGNGAGGGGVVSPANTPPIVKSVVASDPRAEVGSPVTLTAIVEDVDTPLANLTYTWTAETGTFSGTGATVVWTPGTDAKTPGDIVVALTVSERVTSGSVQIENKSSGTVTVHVNNSPKELADLSLRFLGDFANSKVSPAQCVSDFSSNCRGKADELADIDDNRHDYEIVASTLKHTSLSIAANRQAATVHTFCSFTSRVISTQPRDEVCQNGKCPLGSTGVATGDCWTTNVYEQGRWWLCESHFTGQPSLVPSSFVPTLFRRGSR
jgi:hypothetical protein